MECDATCTFAPCQSLIYEIGRVARRGNLEMGECGKFFDRQLARARCRMILVQDRNEIILNEDLVRETLAQR